jgi:hypothetical protein
MLMGNRGGRLHRADGTLGRARWRSLAWIACLTSFGDRRRQVWGQGYTEIFFLDEATALAAGHRPCFECRRADARAFAAAWARAEGTAPPRAPEMDRRLHGERTAAPQRLALAEVPAGAIFGEGGGYFLRTRRGARAWGFDGYGEERAVDPAAVVAVLTPHTVRAVLAAGYRPGLHASAQLSAR